MNTIRTLADSMLDAVASRFIGVDPTYVRLLAEYRGLDPADLQRAIDAAPLGLTWRPGMTRDEAIEDAARRYDIDAAQLRADLDDPDFAAYLVANGYPAE